MINTCGCLIRKAKGLSSLRREQDNQQLWDFARTWIKRFNDAENSNVAEKLIYLWVTVNAWASKVVPDLTKNHQDAYLVHCMAKDELLNQRFVKAYKSLSEFKSNVDQFLGVAPVFQALWLRNKGIPSWNRDEDRSEYTKRVESSSTYIPNNRPNKPPYSAFAPSCAFDHINWGEAIPADWPHVISMIYQVRCNLFHGGKNFNHEGDRLFIELAYKILWEIWQEELPSSILSHKKSWDEILIRSGFLFKRNQEQYDFSEELQDNFDYFEKLVEKGGFGRIEGFIFFPDDQRINENQWLQIVKESQGGAESCRPDELKFLEPYMAGFVRWINVLGIKTSFSCDGVRQRQRPMIEIVGNDSLKIANWLLAPKKIEIKKSHRNRNYQEIAHVRQLRSSNHRNLSEPVFLLDTAEWLYKNQIALKSVCDSMKRMSVI